MGRVPDVHTEQPRFYPPLLDQLRRENAIQPEVAKVWSRFQELAAIPRPTKGEKQAANWVKQWAMERNYDVSQDEFGNVFVQVPESKGFTPTESIPNLIFQGHLDMVDIPTATKDDQHISPGTYGVEPKVETRTDGTLVVVGTNKGKRTSLGADNGIGVAGMMTMAEYFDEHSDTPHAGFGLLFTLHEEDGLLGAHNLAITDVFKPNTLVINVDNEKKENVCLGSAGGGYTDAKVHVNREVIPFDAQVLEISITGHHGGHSGADISTVDTNANQTVGRLLKRALESEPKIDLQLVAIDGGEKKNA
ncbi:MAG: M28 family peptidase, partial [Patescibacteria group bacterium]|nr:M28 family peptidase [Patescibacteria group bacterium]